MPETMKPRVSLTHSTLSVSALDSSRMENKYKLLMLKSSHEVILKKSKIKNYPSPHYSGSRSWRICEAKAICSLYRKPWLKKQPNTQNAAPHGTNLWSHLLGKLWQEDHKFKACLGYETNSRPKALATYCDHNLKQEVKSTGDSSVVQHVPNN